MCVCVMHGTQMQPPHKPALERVEARPPHTVCPCALRHMRAHTHTHTFDMQIPGAKLLQAELVADVVAQLPVVELVRGVVARFAAKVDDPRVGAAPQ